MAPDLAISMAAALPIAPLPPVMRQVFSADDISRRGKEPALPVYVLWFTKYLKNNRVAGYALRASLDQRDSSDLGSARTACLF